jgi:hypothetical protein
LEIQAGAELFRAFVAVRRVVPKIGVAFQFTEVVPHERELLNRLMARLSLTKGLEKHVTELPDGRRGTGETSNYGVCVNGMCDLSYDSETGKRLQEHIWVLETQEKKGTRSDELLEQINEVAPKIYQDVHSCRNCGRAIVAVPNPSHPVQVNILLAKIEFLQNHGALSRSRAQKAPDSQPVSLTEAIPAWEPGRERRVNRRPTINLPILVRSQRNEQEIRRTVNVSRGGVRVMLSMLLAVGDTVDVICPYDPTAENISQKARVRWRSVEPFDAMWAYGLSYERL